MQTAERVPAPRTTRPPLVKVGMAVAALAVVVATGLGVRWWTHPTLFHSLGDSFAADPRAVSEASLSTGVIFPQTKGEPEIVTIDELEAIFSENSAEATATFLICHLQPGEDPILAVHDPSSSCADITPVDGATSFDYGAWPGGDHLFVTVAPTRAGIAHLERVRIRYSRAGSHLYQRGTQSIRVDRTVRAN